MDWRAFENGGSWGDRVLEKASGDLADVTPEKINLCSLTFTRALLNLYINIITF